MQKLVKSLAGRRVVNAVCADDEELLKTKVLLNVSKCLDLTANAAYYKALHIRAVDKWQQLQQGCYNRLDAPALSNLRRSAGKNGPWHKMVLFFCSHTKNSIGRTRFEHTACYCSD